MDATNILGSVSLIIAVWTAIISMNTWRREYIGKRDFEFTEEVLSLFYEARDAIRDIRSPVRYVGEGSSRKEAPNESQKEKEINDRAYVVVERYNKHQELFNKLYSMRYRYMARFGNNAAKPFDDLKTIEIDIFSSAEMLTYYWSDRGCQQLRDETESQHYPDRRQDYEAVIWRRLSGKDQITLKVDAIISEIEAKSAKIKHPSLYQKIKQWFTFR